MQAVFQAENVKARSLGSYKIRDSSIERLPLDCSTISVAQGGQGHGKVAWLMPHQTQDRQEGAKIARALNSKRTPIGAFASFDLSKAPK
jgi:hypothetical protein